MRIYGLHCFDKTGYCEKRHASPQKKETKENALQDMTFVGFEPVEKRESPLICTSSLPTALLFYLPTNKHMFHSF